MKNTIINSTLALTSAYLLAIILHEVAHYLMALALGHEPTLFHNRVEYQNSGNRTHEILIAGIGPVFSLFQGALAYQLAKKMQPSIQSLFFYGLE